MAESAPMRALADDDRATPPPPAPPPAVRFDPLVHPVAITGRSVIGDQIQVPATWCAMAECEAAFADPAALGERDNRARAMAAGWVTDALGRLVCTTCQRDRPMPVWWVRSRQSGASGDHRPAGVFARPADDTQAARPATAGRPPAATQGRHQRAQRSRLLAGLVRSGPQ